MQGRYREVEILIHAYDRERVRNGLDDNLLENYVKAVSYIMFTEGRHDEALKYSALIKGYVADEIDKKTEGTLDFWGLEKMCQQQGVQSPTVEWVYQLFLMESLTNFESYIFYLEKKRPQEKRFYLPRRSVLKTVMSDLEDLANREIKFLGISLPSRTGKSTLAIFFMSWIALMRPNSASAMGGHSGILARGYYQELLSIIGGDDYTFKDMYMFWHKDLEFIQDKSAEYFYINLGDPSRFATITCRGIDGSWTGAVDITIDGLLLVDDLVRDREHSLSPSRMENTWQEYLNKMVDRKSGKLPPNSKFAGSCELMIGTLWNVYDPLYRMETLYGENPLYRFRKIPALNEKDETNFPYQYTTEYLHEMRERLDAAEWASKWMQAPYVREGLLYLPNELNYFNGEVTENVNKIIGVLDPAVGGGANLSMVIVAEGKRKYAIDWVYSNETRAKTVSEICRKVIFHNITEIHYERNGVGQLFDEPIRKELHSMGYYRCKLKSFTAPEGGKGSRGLTKEELIVGYSDWVKQNLWFIDETAHNTTYTRSQQYIKAMNDIFMFTTVGKNKTIDAPDNVMQVARMYESQKNGTIDIILNPFR